MIMPVECSPASPGPRGTLRPATMLLPSASPAHPPSRTVVCVQHLGHRGPALHASHTVRLLRFGPESPTRHERLCVASQESSITTTTDRLPLPPCTTCAR